MSHKWSKVYLGNIEIVITRDKPSQTFEVSDSQHIILYLSSDDARHLAEGILQRLEDYWLPGYNIFEQDEFFVDDDRDST